MKREHYFFLGLVITGLGVIIVPVGVLLIDSNRVNEKVTLLSVATILVIIGLVLIFILSRPSRKVRIRL